MSTRPTFSISGVLLLGLIFHLVFINSVFDCYFTSHVVHGMRHFKTQTGEAKRLVLIVGDGLRADLLFNRNAFFNVVPDAPEFVAPHLRSIAQHRGAFGVSHTRVPTESRPGHVALIGGMYEDVSAVTKGWKTNPVDFDSVFNQSSHTYSFGSPDILPMFARGAVPGRVSTWMYDEDDEDFTRDATELDIWSLDHLKKLLDAASTNSTLDRELREEKVVFFLHLLGLDTTGHSYRPFSKEYMNNIRVVDDIVRETEEVIAAFYGDAETAFVFTADHGMSVIGNHGDGHPYNPRTPLSEGGKGVRSPLPDTVPSSHDAYSAPWGLGDLYRRDVEQADVAALMAALIGVSWPVNSVGVLPDTDLSRPGYLVWEADANSKRLEAGRVNAMMLFEHYEVKHNLTRSRVWNYKPYPALEEVRSALEDHDSGQLIRFALQGLRYLDTYDRTLIRTIVMFAYSGWMAYTASLLLAPTATSPSMFRSPLPLAALAALWAFLVARHAPVSFYAYGAFPVFFWHHAISRLRTYATGMDNTHVSATTVLLRTAQFAVVVASLLGMVVGYMHRSVWSAAFVLIGLVWPVTAWPAGMMSKNRALTAAWMTSCLVSAVFPLLSVNKEESIPLILAGAAGMVGVASVWWSAMESAGYALDGPVYDTILRQVLLLLPTAFVTTAAIAKLSAKEGLPRLLQIAGWALFGISMLLPFVNGDRHRHEHSKMLALFLAGCPLFVLLSISTEGLFYAAYAAVLVLWLAVETAVRGPVEKAAEKAAEEGAVYRPKMEDVRIALFFLFFVQVGFFGTGNVASISSFYLAPVYRLVPTFRPFIMAALLIMKILAPYVPLSAVFAALHVRLGLPPFALFLVALTLTDVMTAYFFFAVRDEGSWLEIGQSITFFCIASLLCVFSCGVCAAGEGLVGGMMRRPIVAEALEEEWVVIGEPTDTIVGEEKEE